MKLLGIKDKLKKLITSRGGEKEHLPVLRALGNRVRQNVNTNYPTVEITLKESDALKWFKGTQREFGSDISLSPFELYGHIATSFDDEGFLEYGSWSVEVPYSSPGSGIDVTAYGRLQNMPEPPMKTAESHMVSVNLKFKSKKDTPSRREWMQALANDFIDANAAMANETQRAWAGQVENQELHDLVDMDFEKAEAHVAATIGLDLGEAEALAFTLYEKASGKDIKPPDDYFQNIAKALRKIGDSLPDEVLDFVDTDTDEPPTEDDQ